jgi:hypothetical protein
VNDRARAPIGWWVAWGLTAALSAAGAGAFGLMAFAFLQPHAFGGRDGQGAAGLAALVLLVGGAVMGVGLVAMLLVSGRLHAKAGVRWPRRVALALLAVAVVGGASFALFS